MTRPRRLTIVAGAAGCALGIGPVLANPAPRLLFNTTASAPIGLYLVGQDSPRIGDWVVVRPPAALADWMARRGYLPAHALLLKRLAAVDSQTVCGREGRLFIDGRLVAVASKRDRWRRPLSAFGGCRRLAAGEVLVVNAEAPLSLDGRYFGPLPRTTIVGRAAPLWTTKGR